MGQGIAPANPKDTFHGGKVLRFTLFFSFGVLVFHQLSWLPDWRWAPLELVILLGGALVWRARPVTALLAGFAWSHIYALLTLPALLPGGQQVLNVEASGRVISLVERSDQVTRFLFEADHIDGLEAPLAGRWLLRLSWWDAPQIEPGDAWHLPVRLRAAHGYATPGAWDYEGWLYWQGVRYTGYVNAQQTIRRNPDADCCWLNRLRQRVSNAVDAAPASAFARGVIRAISVGDRSGLTPEARELFRATGTSHLMAISGLHVGLLAALGLAGLTWCWRRIPALCARLPARVAGGVAGVVAAAAYAALAGMSLPTQRALIMLLVFASALLARRANDRLHALAIALVAVLVWHPPSVIAAGLWLSFGAVAAILAALTFDRTASGWRLAVRIQLAISLLLIPLLAVFGLPISRVAPLVNLLLVPLFGLIVVPLGLLGSLLAVSAPRIGDWLLGQLGTLIDWMADGLAWVGTLPGSTTDLSGLGVVDLLAMLLALGLLMAPPGFPLRWMGIPLFATALFARVPQLSSGDFEIHLLDVGQGLSAVVQTRQHTLVFDTGPEFRSGFSAAAAVVAPFLAQRGIHRIDRLVVSHGDNDHAGGLRQLARRIDVGQVQAGEPDRIELRSQPCIAGDSWQWDGVAFEYLHPPLQHRYAGNDASCVLRVSNAAGAVLLTGDIEQRIERMLAESTPEKLRSHAVLAPHHGSRSSSSAEFVRATNPVYVLYAAGWANRYGFPASDVDLRWRAAGVIPLSTARRGTIHLHYGDDGVVSGPRAFRDTARRFWWHNSGAAEQSLAVSSGD
jgi:competence protein ComEC